MSAHRLPTWFLSATWKVSDPGASGTFNLQNKGRVACPITTAGAEARTIPAPEIVGQEIIVYMDTDGGDATVTVTGGSGITSFILDDAGDTVVMKSVAVAGTAKWVVVGAKGVAVAIVGVQTFSTGIVVNSVSGGGSTIAFTDRMTTTDGVSSGTARVIGGLAYSNTAASTTIGNTGGSETLFDLSYSIPANTLKAGTKVRVRYAGFGVTGIGSDTFAHKLYIGGSSGTALITSATAVLATNGTFTGETELICRTAGATGTAISFGTYKQSSAEGTMTVKDDYVASTTINTTAAQSVCVTGTWNSNNANSARLDILFVEIV